MSHKMRQKNIYIRPMLALTVISSIYTCQDTPKQRNIKKKLGCKY